MSWKFNPFSGSLDYYATSFTDITVAGKIYLGNTDTYIWYDGVDSVVLVVNGTEMQRWTNASTAQSKILLEDGFNLLLETGDSALLEA